MIGLEDRRSLARDIETAHVAGARLHLACDIAGIDERTLQRWKAQAGLVEIAQHSVSISATLRSNCFEVARP